MICPRCENDIDYGLKTCPFCGLGFKYSEPSSEYFSLNDKYIRNDKNANTRHDNIGKTYERNDIANKAYERGDTPHKTYERRQQELDAIKHTKERRRKQSGAKRVTASSLCIMFGAIGLHNFYLGHFLKGTVRLVLFLLCCGFFFSPVIASVINTGTIKFLFDGYGIFGICMLFANIISYMLALVEFVRLILGVTNTDAKGYGLR